VGKVEGLFAGDKASAAEVLADLIGACEDGILAKVFIVTVSPSKEFDVVYSTMPLPELALCANYARVYVDEVVRDILLGDSAAEDTGEGDEDAS